MQIKVSGRDMASLLDTRQWTGSCPAISRLLTSDQRFSAAGANRDPGGGRGRDFPNTVSIQINNPVIDTSAAAGRGRGPAAGPGCLFVISL